ncbi:MAG: S41 family peptidase [Bacteroidota bacterium]
MNKTSILQLLALSICICAFSSPAFGQDGFAGYYRYPDAEGNQVVFTAEGDLWTVSINGGVARRLTSHQEEELYARFSPDGETLAFSASYEGPLEVYTMPVNGGLPKRWTYDREASVVNGWTPEGKVIYDTREFSGVPDRQVVMIDPATQTKEIIPLSQASEASFDDSGSTVYFVRPAYHRNVTKRYKGGTARQVWKYTFGAEEAEQLTKEYTGESHHPMWLDGRVYFISDRDGVMNIWSMTETGFDLRQHTEHKQFDVRYANIADGNIVYQHGADIWVYRILADTYAKIDITLASDLDQLREKWVDNPKNYITSMLPDPKGEKVVIVSRGRAFVMPVKQGRNVAFTQQKDVRYRDAVFSADGQRIITLSDESGEFEFVSMPATGIGGPKSITSDGKVLRFGGVPSGDGKWLAYTDLERNLYLLDLASGVSKLISTNQEGVGDISWSPDDQWVAFSQRAANTMRQIFIHNVKTGESFPLTTDRANSVSPCWSPDGQFIYFLSDRSFTSLVGSPWGARQPEPYLDAQEKLYHIPLKKGTRSPFQPDDELFTASESKGDAKVVVAIDRDGIQQRMAELPIKAGNYQSLSVTNDAIYLISRETGIGAKQHLEVLKIGNESPKLNRFVSDIRWYEMAAEREKMLLRKGQDFYMVDAGTSELKDLSKSKIDLSGWKFSITPQDDWRQLFIDAWRMERDYFYDKNMHGVNWEAMRDKYLPLVDRVTTRSELSDLIGRFVGELSALHTSVRGGDMREDDNDISIATLGGRFSRASNGFRIDYIYQADPDYPEGRSPLDDPFVDVRVGDIITHIDGISTTDAVELDELIRDKADQQVRLRIARGGSTRDVIVIPKSSDYDIRYRDWEYTRRLQVERKSGDQIGYLHLRAMGSRDISQFYREFYPVFNRSGLIIDVRYNFGGNIDSFILEKLLRKAWMYWKSRAGKPYWNMQYAFRGHIVVLVNENTYSDGEAFADGFRRLGLGTTIGTRTWGGEIWLNSANRLTDGGLARAPMMGVYSAEGEWLIEGHGFEPDIVVDNLPHATFKGQDAQLDAAINHLLKKIEEDPREVPAPPAYPDKSFFYSGQ